MYGKSLARHIVGAQFAVNIVIFLLGKVVTPGERTYAKAQRRLSQRYSSDSWKKLVRVQTKP